MFVEEIHPSDWRVLDRPQKSGRYVFDDTY